MTQDERAAIDRTAKGLALAAFAVAMCPARTGGTGDVFITARALCEAVDDQFDRETWIALMDETHRLVAQAVARLPTRGSA